MDKRVKSDWTIGMVKTVEAYMPLLVQQFYNLYNEKNVELQRTKIEKHIDRQLNMYTKLYMAILTELDQEVLHKQLRRLLINKSYVKISIIEILKCCIDRTMKMISPRKQIDAECTIYHDILKNEEFAKINDMMLAFTKELKYNRYKPTIEKNDDDIKPIELRKFPLLNRYNSEMYVYTSKDPLELQIENYVTNKYKNYRIVKFIRSSNTHIFDVLSCGNRMFTDMSWQVRLDMIDPAELTSDYKIINIHPIPYESIQFKAGRTRSVSWFGFRMRDFELEFSETSADVRFSSFGMYPRQYR